jgi:hypothetical protein
MYLELLGGPLPWAAAGSMEELVALKESSGLEALTRGLAAPAAAFVRAALSIESPTGVDYAALRGCLAPLLPKSGRFAWTAGAGARAGGRLLVCWARMCVCLCLCVCMCAWCGV